MAENIELLDEELEEVVGGAYNPNGNPQLSGPVSYSGKCFKYWIQPSDTLSSIALAFGKNLSTLQRINAIADPNWIYPGQYMWIPE